MIEKIIMAISLLPNKYYFFIIFLLLLFFNFYVFPQIVQPICVDYFADVFLETKVRVTVQCFPNCFYFLRLSQVFTWYLK